MTHIHSWEKLFVMEYQYSNNRRVKKKEEQWLVMNNSKSLTGNDMAVCKVALCALLMSNVDSRMEI